MSARVVAVVVDPIDSVFRRGCLSHIIEKGQKVVAPSLTDGYTSPAIPMIRGSLGIKTSTRNALPDAIFQCHFAIDRMPMRPVPATMTMKRIPALKISRLDQRLITTLALTQPESLADRTASSKTNNSEFPKNLPCEIQSPHFLRS